MSFISKLFEPKPFNQGYLPEEQGHRVFFMEFGNPQGKPILVFHGGPGGSCKAKYARIASFKKYRIIMFDQRGCGKSLPLGEMKYNSTQASLEDAQRLLNYLKINEKIIIRGASWGSTLALLFAIEHLQMVNKLLLSQIFLADKDDLDWEMEESAKFYPDFLEKIKGEVRDATSVREYYAQLINSNDVAQQQKAFDLYVSYECVLGSLQPQFNESPLNEKNLAEARIYINYAAQKFMLKDKEILHNAHKIAHIPTLIVHNRLDFVCPLQGAYELHKALPQSKLVIVPERGHYGQLLSKTRDKEIKDFL